MGRETFTIVGTSSTVTLCMPEWSGEDNNISKGVRLFNFWDGDLDTVDEGINEQPLVLTGVECVADNNGGLCIPFCFPLCFTTRLSTNVVERLHTMMNSGEEVTLSTLGDCQNGVYVIKDFTWDTIKGSNCCYAWSINFELVREL